ncbi:MAG: LysR substrate-binding domain-containing protein [Rhodospirillaceae bacterium]|nr:LysR substrate-binding domain-containing protein [Rhodospirillaceae bacterium]
MRAFEAVSRHRSVSGAAEELSVTPGAVSRQISRLETELGCPLLVRQHRGMEPTPAGHILAQTLTNTFDQIDATIRDIRANTAVERLSVFSHATVAVEWLVPRIGSFHRSHPEIDLQLFPMLEPKGLYDGSVDAGVWSGTEDGPATASEPLFYPEYFPICSPALLTRETPLTQPGDLLKHTLLGSSYQFDSWKGWMQTVGITDFDVGRIQRFDTSAHAYRAARDGLGIALGQRLFVSNDIAAGTLAMPFPIGVRDPVPYSLICLRSRRQEPKIRAFLEWLRSALQEADRVAQSVLPRDMKIGTFLSE